METVIVVEVNKKEKTVKQVAEFKSKMLAEVSCDSLNEMIRSDWYEGNKSLGYGWSTKDIHHYGAFYGLLVI